MDLTKKLQQERDEKIKYRKIVESLSSQYQNIYLINAETALVEIIKLNGHCTCTQENVDIKLYPYEKTFNSYISTRVVDDDVNAVTEYMMLDNVVKKITSERSYEFTYRVLTNGNEENYKAQYFSVDNIYILCCLKNIDLQVAVESKNNENLHAVIDQMTTLNDELSEYINIISNAGYGIWHIVIKDGVKPRMQVNEKMAELLGIEPKFMTEEEIYASWYDCITSEAIPSVQASVQEMMDGKFSENTYKWEHPSKGIIYVRCGGTCIQLPDGSCILRGYHTDVTDIVRAEQEHKEKLEKAKCAAEAHNRELVKHLSIINTIAKIFNGIYYINMKDYSFVELGETLPFVNGLVRSSGNALEAFEKLCNDFVLPEMHDECREFLDITTINSRLNGKIWISRNFREIYNEWFEGIFIVVDRDDDGNCKHIIFAARNINEIKKREEQLIYSSNTDEMTHFYNRRAYENAIKEYESTSIPEDLVYISIDVNGLKVVNDSLGHEAGDELILGACQCMTKCFSKYGKLYRTGGDEFTALLNMTKEDYEQVKLDIEKVTAEWTGNLVKSLAISCGYVLRWEKVNLTMHEISVLADQRMYAAKAEYYKSKGIDRRGQKDAYAGLSTVYDKMLKINITDDNYQVLNIGEVETMDDIRNIATISEWFSKFAHSTIIHPDDAENFLAKTDFSYMRAYFKEGKKRLPIEYRKKYGDVYRRTVTEIIISSEHTEDSEIFYLYVKKLEE